MGNDPLRFMSSDFHQYNQILWVKQNNPFATNTGIIVSEGQACLIDPGISPIDCTQIKDLLIKLGAQARSILLTHAHWDHLLGVQYFPGKQVIVQKKYHEITRDHNQHLVMQVSEWCTSENRSSTLWEPPEPSIIFMHKINLRVGDISICLYSAPGHTADHAIAYVPEEKILWAGDMLSDRELPLVEDIADYQRTLAYLQEMDVDILVPGHGTLTTDSGEIRTRLFQDENYVRTLRQCVENALTRGFDLTRTVKVCLDVPFSQPDTYPNAHRWNIESAYSALGGTAIGLVGWEKEWPDIAK